MINLEVDKFTDSASQKFPTLFVLTVNDETYSFDYGDYKSAKPFTVWRWSGPPYLIDSIEDESLAEKIKACQFCEIGPEIQRIQLQAHRLFQHPFVYQRIAVEQLNEKFYITMFFGFSSRHWNLPWSFSNYEKMMRSLIFEHYKETATLLNIEDPVIRETIAFRVDTPTSTIEAELSNLSLILKEMNTIAEETLASSIDKNSIRILFSFPDEVKVPCEQYLLYFSQFLQDLGVKADTSIQDEVGQVLFTVKPTERTDALEKIREALNLYLKLPLSPISDSANESIATQRLESTILRLRSDLKLAAAELQAKYATIEAQQLIINVQKGLLSGEILRDSIKYEAPQPEDKEYLMRNMVSLGTFEKGGVGFHLGEMLRKLKQWFAEDKQKDL